MTKFVTPFVMAGVAGHLAAIVTRTATTFNAQKWRSEWRAGTFHGTPGVIRATIRFDDECGNGKNSFSITGEAYETYYDQPLTPKLLDRYMITAGCCHEDIARIFPELAPFIKWHLTDSDAPMHYIANALYHAGDRDCHGLLKGEKRQIINGKSGLPAWHLVAFNEAGEEIQTYSLPKSCDSATPPESTFSLKWVAWCREGEGKERDLNAARSCAVWPDATDEELSAPRDVLEAALKARHPALMAEFRSAMDSLGFQWSPEKESATA